MFLLGDFAVLLQAGLTVRKALFYNLLSSALSLFGTVLGLLISNFGDATQWVYAITAGCFIYIALSNLVRYFSAFILSIKYTWFLFTLDAQLWLLTECASAPPHLPAFVMCLSSLSHTYTWTAWCTQPLSLYHQRQ